MVIVCVLHTAESFYLELCRLAYLARTSQFLPHPGHWPLVVTDFCMLLIQCNDTTNDIFFIMSDGGQNCYGIFLGSRVQDWNPQTLSCGQVATHLSTAFPCVCVGKLNGSCARLNGHTSSLISKR